jgi:hypothetical protein
MHGEINRKLKDPKSKIGKFKNLPSSEHATFGIYQLQNVQTSAVADFRTWQLQNLQTSKMGNFRTWKLQKLANFRKILARTCDSLRPRFVDVHVLTVAAEPALVQEPHVGPGLVVELVEELSGLVQEAGIRRLGGKGAPLRAVQEPGGVRVVQEQVLRQEAWNFLNIALISSKTGNNMQAYQAQKNKFAMLNDQKRCRTRTHAHLAPRQLR